MRQVISDSVLYKRKQVLYKEQLLEEQDKALVGVFLPNYFKHVRSSLVRVCKESKTKATSKKLILPSKYIDSSKWSIFAPLSSSRNKVVICSSRKTRSNTISFSSFRFPPQLVAGIMQRQRNVLWELKKKLTAGPDPLFHFGSACTVLLALFSLDSMWWSVRPIYYCTQINSTALGRQQISWWCPW